MTAIKASQLIYSGNLNQSKILRLAVESDIDNQPGKSMTDKL